MTKTLLAEFTAREGAEDEVARLRAQWVPAPGDEVAAALRRFLEPDRIAVLDRFDRGDERTSGRRCADLRFAQSRGT